ncbi:Membrane-fusion protein [Frankia sp. AiPs1]|uniref:efflux RND transporter periplasmic adaptor subunit n=1 Tax=Frankia sp. AiPa1 TaxID=573492 RepID=UPI00202B51CA|nr:efflux RND transporter periplasmic adaptor subunit [Frankia sp. AiPa1]MCL9760230.1 efflux RND transporter periplasmic adaptor subunit [Frankia sp. AiPa1]
MTRRTAALATLIGILALAVGGVLLAWALSSDSGDGEQTAQATAKAQVRDLELTQTLSGVIAYRDLRDLYPARQGTVTWLPPVGTDLSSGQVLMRIDDRPVVLLDGKVPAWRDLQPGVGDGADVLELETALLALGHGHKSPTFPDAHWDAQTTDALKELQAATGAVVDATAALGDLMFTDGPIHVAKLGVQVGAQAAPDASVLSVSGIEKIVTLDLNPLDRNLVSQGAPVLVDLPTGQTAAGTIDSVGGSLEMNADNKQVFKVKVVLKDPKVAATLDLAPVTVHYTTVTAKKVLTVPVSAVIAVPGGGYAVDVVKPQGGHQRATVKLGAWGDGFVGVSGGLATGSLVEVPR